MENLKQRTQEIIDYITIGNTAVASSLLQSLTFEVNTKIDTTQDTSEIVELSKYKALLEMLNKKI